MTALLQIMPKELMLVWGELIECYHGVNGFGGNVAEIYTYRLVPYTPSIHSAGGFKEGSHEHQTRTHFLNFQAAEALIEIVELFCSEFACRAIIDKMPLNRWQNEIGRQGLFGHRAHVEIVKAERTRS